MWPVDFCPADDSTVLKHIFKVDQIAVVHMLCKIVGIMEMDNSFFMSLCYIFIEKKSAGNVLTHFSSHVVTLHADNSRILVGIFLFDFLVVFFKQTHDFVVCGIGLSHEFMFVTVRDIQFCNIIRVAFQYTVFNKILNFFNIQGMLFLCAFDFYIVDNRVNLSLCKLPGFFCLIVGFRNRDCYFITVKRYLSTASFDDFH